MMNNKKPLPGILCGTLLALALMACSQDVITPEPTLSVSLYEVGAVVEKGERKFHGQVVPADLTRVACRIPGRIAELAVQSGEEVRAGQVLARIEDSIQQQMLVDARAQYQLSRRQLKRGEDLFKLGSLTPAQQDELKAAFRLARANLELAKARKSYTRLVAPFDGTIAEVDKELFEAVAPGETVVTLYRTDRTDVLVNVPDGLTSRMHESRGAEFFNIRAQFKEGGEIRPMTYLKHSSARNPHTQSFQIWVTSRDPAVRVPPGTPATITADLGQAGFTLESGLLVPLTALQADVKPNSFRVWRYRDGRVEPVPVSIGKISANGALVTGGLAAGDQVAVSRLARLAPGLAIEIHGQQE